MMRAKKKYVHGRPPLKRSKLLMATAAVILIAILFVPWQAIVLKQSSAWQSHVRQGLLGETASTTAGSVVPNSGPGSATIQKLTDPLHAYGLAVGGGLAGKSAADINKELDDIVSMGATWVRFDVEWQNIQNKDASQYDWTDYDKVAKAASAHHLKMLGILAYTPAWARPACGSPQCPPKDPAAFAKFSAQAAVHFAPMGLQAWEIWNEPNTKQFWQSGADAGAYTRMLQAAYTAIKLANPQAIVVAGGLSPQATGDGNMSELDFLQGIYSAGGKGFFDAVADHPYTYPLVPSNSTGQAWSRMSQTAVSLRSIMTANGDGVKKIWITEFGAPTGGPGAAANEENYATVHDTWHVDEQLQADMVARAVELYKGYDWVGPFMYYSYKDLSNDQANNENFFGLLRANGSQKPAYATFKQAIH